jgi:hypothetical protein
MEQNGETKPTEVIPNERRVDNAVVHINHGSLILPIQVPNPVEQAVRSSTDDTVTGEQV